MWSSWRRFSFWMAAQSSGSVLARVFAWKHFGFLKNAGEGRKDGDV
jgi:hypothetical protein